MPKPKKPLFEDEPVNTPTPPLKPNESEQSIMEVRGRFLDIPRIVPNENTRLSIALKIKEGLLENCNPKEVHVILKSWAEIIDAAIEMNKDKVFVAEKDGEDVLGAIVAMMSTRASWDYGSDPKLKELQEKVKERQKYLQNLTEDEVDEKTGEVTAIKAIKKSAGGFVPKVTLPK